MLPRPVDVAIRDNQFWLRLLDGYYAEEPYEEHYEKIGNVFFVRSHNYGKFFLTIGNEKL